MTRYTGCDPDAPGCRHPRQHTSLDCYARYVELEYDEPAAAERIMTFEQWSQVDNIIHTQSPYYPYQ